MVEVVLRASPHCKLPGCFPLIFTVLSLQSRRMFHIALLLLLAGHELLLRPVGATSLTSENVEETVPVTSGESNRVERDKWVLTKKERDGVRSVIEITANYMYYKKMYHRANGTELIEKLVNIFQLINTTF